MNDQGLPGPLSLEAASFRLPQEVTQAHLFRDRTAYPVCPRFCRTLEREYQSFCYRCGQALSWGRYRKDLVVFIT